MKLSRRSFLKLTGTTAATATLVGAGFRKASASYESTKLDYAREVPTVCTFCGVGCGVICQVKDGVIVGTEGDPDHPVNEGTLCSKGSAYYNISYIFDEKGNAKPNPNRLTKPLYREPNAHEWQEVDWDEALDMITRRIKDTRDEYFEERNANGDPVNRTNALAWLGSAFCTDEENYLFHKMARSMGIINMDHCARL